MLDIDGSLIDALYNRGVCFMHLNDHSSAIPDFLSVYKVEPMYDHQLYVALSICYTNLSDLKSGLRAISKGIKKYP